jgi:hypothetical protein
MPLTAEWQLLLSCAKTQPTGTDVQRFHEALRQPRLAWARVTQRAYTHGIAPLLFHTIRQMSLAELLPSAVLEAWQRVYYATAVNHTLSSQALHRALRALEGRGIAAIVLKGAALAETVYPSGAVRPRRDVDLLVRAEDLSGVEDALEGLGYQFTGSGLSKAWWRTQHYHWAFRQPAAPPFDVPLEVHWYLERPSRPFSIDLEGLWQRAMPAIIAGVDTRILAPEDSLAYLCLHACHHAGAPLREPRLNFRLLSFCDMGEVVRHYTPSLDWASLAQRVQQWGIGPFVYLPLQLARRLVGAAVPESALAALEPEGFDARLISWACDEVLEDPGTSVLFPDLLRLWRGRWLKDRAAVVERVLSPARIAKYYGVPSASKRRYGYYPARLKDLLVRYGPVLWRLIRRDPALAAEADRKVHLSAWLSPFNNRPDDAYRLH